MAKAGTSGLAPWRDETWEIWGIPWISYPRVTRLFDTHGKGQISEDDHDTIDGIARSNGRWPDVPVYCFPDRTEAYGAAVPYPLEEVMASLPIAFLENTVAYQIALAIHERVDRIGLWGVHMRGRHEYDLQRPSVTYLVGLAQGMGIDVEIVPGSPLFMSGYVMGRYGITSETR